MPAALLYAAIFAVIPSSSLRAWRGARSHLKGPCNANQHRTRGTMEKCATYSIVNNVRGAHLCCNSERLVFMTNFKNWHEVCSLVRGWPCPRSQVVDWLVFFVHFNSRLRPKHCTRTKPGSCRKLCSNPLDRPVCGPSRWYTLGPTVSAQLKWKQYYIPISAARFFVIWRARKPHPIYYLCCATSNNSPKIIYLQFLYILFISLGFLEWWVRQPKQLM